jgi:hypothetical protein
MENMHACLLFHIMSIEKKQINYSEEANQEEPVAEMVKNKTRKSNMCSCACLYI